MVDLLDYAIVPAGPGDAADLARVHVKSWRETYPGHLPQTYLNGMRPSAHARRFYRDLMRASPGEVVLLAESAEGPVGYASGARLKAETRPADSEVFTLYVLKAAQKAGLGRALLNSAARVFQADGARSLMLRVLSSNRKARGFYEHLGGEAFAEVPSQGWGGGLTEIAYRWGDIARLTK
ncbi:MAG: GNAT family N-acetyltransferase [Caulobacteraceae bacterium]|nr:GNAT family N-acetyltransferase [Caulobacteraceae bacterium]